MQIYDFVTQHCIANGQTADTAEVQRIVGTLICAGFTYEVGEKDAAVGKEIIQDMIRSRSQMRVARVVVNNSERAQDGTAAPVGSSNSEAQFLEIEAYIKKGHCPRCKTPMDKVKLGSKAPNGREFLVANYCKTCKTTLWTK